MEKLKFMFLLVVIFATNYVSAQTAEKSDTATNVVILNKVGFLEKVWNYEKNSEQWVYEGSLPCIIDFYADWCGPCRRVSPILKELAKEYQGKIIVYKIDIDKERELASVFQVKSIPSYLFIPAKGEPQTSFGALPRDYFVKAINDFLLKKEQTN
ncbi:MAG: thioredoxin family protein [Tannerella sp.]|jgi:thioredoxin|nr:thioredoxin family protein [Tannerella sp.]